MCVNVKSPPGHAQPLPGQLNRAQQTLVAENTLQPDPTIPPAMASRQREALVEPGSQQQKQQHPYSVQSSTSR